MSFDVKATVRVYELDDEGKWGDDLPPLVLESHWNDNDFAVIEVAGHRCTVVISDMRKALAAVGK